MVTVTVNGEGLVLDLILWRQYGVRGRDLLEATLELNPGLSALGLILPLGTIIILPDLPAASQAAVTVTSLFG